MLHEAQALEAATPRHAREDSIPVGSETPPHAQQIAIRAKQTLEQQLCAHCGGATAHAGGIGGPVIGAKEA